MSYQLTGSGPIKKILGNGAILLLPAKNNGTPDWADYLAWLAEGNTPEAADPPPPPPADWRGFLQALRTTTVFASLRGQARVDVGANALATELRTVLGEAALGLVAADAVQGLLDELLPTLTPAQVAEIQGGITAFNVPLSIGGA